MQQPFAKRLATCVAGAALAGTALAPGLLLLGSAAVAQTVVGTSNQAEAEVDPPGRVARLGYFDGTVWRQPPGESEWIAPSINYPLSGGDRLATDTNARAELHLGSTALRLGGQTQMEISTLDDDRAFVTLTQGTLSLRVRTLFPGQHLEVNTGNLAFSITQPGEYRLDVDPASNTTRVSVISGGGVAYGESGQTQVISASQQVRFNARSLSQSSTQNGFMRDAFDQWASSRDQAEEQSQTARYVSRETIGYQQLDNNGEWSTDPSLGAVWYPRVTTANWAPYRYGQWAWVAPWGWTWVDDAPWGFAPFHYGRWAQVGPRWAWVPGPRAQRPTYAPALVGFVGGSSGNVNWSISVGGARQPGVAWFPLAPGEAWRPSYRASARYVGNINNNVVIQRNDRNVYRFQRPETVTAISAEAFQRGRPTRDSFHRVAQNDLIGSRVIGGPDIRPPTRPDRRNDVLGPPGSQGNPGAPPRAMQPPTVAQGVPPQPGNFGNVQRPGSRDDRPNGGFEVRTERQDFFPGSRNDGRPGNQPGRPDDSVREQQRRQQREDEMQRNLTMEQRQQIQGERDQQRRAIADQQQRALQGGMAPPPDPQRRLDRLQDAQQDRARQQQRERDQQFQPQFQQQPRFQQQRQQDDQRQQRDQQQRAVQLQDAQLRQQRDVQAQLQRQQQETQQRQQQVQAEQQVRTQQEQQAQVQQEQLQRAQRQQAEQQARGAREQQERQARGARDQQEQQQRAQRDQREQQTRAADARQTQDQDRGQRVRRDQQRDQQDQRDPAERAARMPRG